MHSLRQGASKIGESVHNVKALPLTVMMRSVYGVSGTSWFITSVCLVFANRPILRCISASVLAIRAQSSAREDHALLHHIAYSALSLPKLNSFLSMRKQMSRPILLSRNASMSKAENMTLKTIGAKLHFFMNQVTMST